ncbi:transglycosylase SLT domain-containing protein [Candidatus Magnetominusculus xianensis]|uniref:Lytic transglycosylase n=1 Tax=Candidatus Magnetominusculus xianensis TaxID=1748249 RepID=A0ABR5SHM8_9BACT|nr:transglycosylase SLT domain-containing protein [Candidatus Magnetominusculus xianensis]KWT91669.1 lytic transglycosylase [Candidatus Magnetominusculus xianensis]MBF0404574.1 transglycosylase SLT domain-containing protein [Nitrospirota bacterium]
MRHLIIGFLTLLLLMAFAPVEDAHAADKLYLYLKEGHTALNNKDYEKSVKELSTFMEKQNLLTDYALFWRAKAYDGLSDKEKALSDLSQIKNDYPNSPLIKNVLQYEIKIETKSQSERAITLIEKYLRDNPDDNALRLTYAKMLGEHDREKDSLREFTRVYLTGGQSSAEAAKYIDTETLSPSSILTRAKNLINKFRYKEAENELRANISRAPDSLKQQYTENIAMALFKQKNYKEASVYFNKIGMTYYEARSLYRAGMYDKFREKLAALDPANTKNAAELTLIHGLYYRRSGNVSKALSVFNSLKENQFVAEKALWHIGWTYFLTGKYSDSYKIFSSLHTKYGTSKYLYWMARSLENNNEDPAALYKQLTAGDDFYAFLSYYKTARQPALIHQAELKVARDHDELRRLAILLELNIEDAIKTESLYIAKHASQYPSTVMMQAAVMLNEASMYRHSVLLAGNLHYSSKTHRLLYPYAYKSTVDEAARRFSINPLLILSVIREESRFQEDAYSPAGAIGLMQLMPQTAQKYSGIVEEKIDSDSDIFNPRKNILIGGYYVSQLVREMRCVPTALASYNAGEHIVYKWLDAWHYKAIDEFIEDIPYDETEKYVKRVLKTYFQYTRGSNPDGEAVNFAFDCQMM